MANDKPVGGQQTIPQYPGEISDPITGSPKWPSSYGGRFPPDDQDEFTEGDAVNITLPADALYDGGGLSYEWSGRAPNLTGTNLTWNPSTYTITSGTGGVTLRVSGRPMYITGNWAAVTTDVVDGPDRDLLRFRIDVRPRNPFVFPNSPITVNVHRNRAISPAASLGTGRGGRRPYRYQVVPQSSPRHSSPRSLASMGIAHNTTTNEIFTPPNGRVIAPVGTYLFQVRAWDAAALEPLGRTLYIRVDRSALPPPPTAELELNDGNDISYTRLLVNQEWNSLLPNRVTGGVPPYRFSFAWDSPPNNGTIRFTQSTGTRGQGSLVRILGIPSRVGTMSGTFTVRDAAGNSDSVAVSLTVLGRRSMPNSVAFTFTPRQLVAENLPQLQNARGTVTYIATGTAGIERLGLAVNTAERTLTGVVVDQPAEADRHASFLWTATDTGDQFSTAVVVSVPRARLTTTTQNDLVLNEGAKPDHRIVPFGGGTGSITYSGTGLPPGLSVRNSGSGYASIVGTAPQVTADRSWSANIIGTDEVGETASAPILVTVRNVETPEPPPPGRLSMADAEFEERDRANTVRELPAALLDGQPTTGVTYPAATLDSGISSPEVRISDTTLTLNLESRDRAVDDPATSIWTRTATRQGLTATSNVTIKQYGRLYFEQPTQLNRFPGDEVDATVPLVLRGGKSPRTVVLESDFPVASGVQAGVSQTTVTVRGTAGAIGSYNCRISATDALGATTNTFVILLVGARNTFRFLEDSYTITTLPGEDVTWQCPEPINADGGILTMATVPAPLPADLRQPTINSAQQWIIEGTVTAPVGTYTHTLVATDNAGNEARTQLIVIVQEAGDPEIPDGGGPGGYGGCGPVIINRVPLSGERRLQLGSVLPLSGDTGPIQMFRPSSFIVGQQASITFDWEVLTEYRGIDILEVDLWRTDPKMPYCAGIPNILLKIGDETTASVPHEVTSGYRTETPLEPLTAERPSQEYLYRLVALRAGSSERYVSADWWDLWVRVTILANDVQISASKTFVPDGYPVMLQWGYKGRQPTTEQVIMTGERRRAVGELSAASIAPTIDWQSDPGEPVDPTSNRPVIPGTNTPIPGLELG